MAYFTPPVGLGSYINPSDLMQDEIDYELRLRGFNMSGHPLEDQREAFRRAQLDEIQNSRALYTKKTIIEELTLIQIKATMIRQEFEIHGPKRQLISRLRHLRLRVLRSNAVDSHQVKIKDDLLRELETIYELFATPDNNISREARFVAGRNSLAHLRDPSLEFPPPVHVPRSSEVQPPGDASTSTQQGQASQIIHQQPQQGGDQRSLMEQQPDQEHRVYEEYKRQMQEQQQLLNERHQRQLLQEQQQRIQHQ